MVSRRTVAVLGAALAASVLTGCGNSDAPEAAGTSATVPATTPVPTTTEAPVPTTSDAPAPTTTTAAPSTTYRRNEAVYFTVASGEFQCGIIELATRVEAGCQGVTSPIPPRPENCMINWGSGIRVTSAGPAEFLCSGGVVYTSGDSGGDAVLPVGQSVASFGFTCTSEAGGASCKNDVSGHGFRIGADFNETF